MPQETVAEVGRRTVRKRRRKNEKQGKEESETGTAEGDKTQGSRVEIKGKTEASYNPESQLAAPQGLLLPSSALSQLLNPQTSLQVQDFCCFRKAVGCICCKERKTIWVKKAT